VIHAVVAEVVRYGRRLLWLAVPTLALAAIAFATRSAPKQPWQPFADLPLVKVTSSGPALQPVVETREWPKGTHSLVGRVIDEYDEPVANADVLLNAHESVRTAADGSFAFHELETGRRWLVARTADMTSGLQHAWAPHEKELILRVHRGATIVIQALELDRRTPIANATIELEYQEGVTAADGTITFHNVDGVYVTARAPSHGVVSCSLDDQLPAKDGAHYWIMLPPGAPIAGVVLDPRGVPLPHARVDVSTIETATWHRDTTPIHTDAYGWWQLPTLAPGRYGLTADAAALFPAAPMPIQVDGAMPRTNLVIRTTYGAQLAGTILDSGGRPVANATVLVEGLSRYWTNTTDGRGRFSLLGMTPGTYSITAWHDGEGARLYRVELRADRRIDVELQTMRSRLSGYVVDPTGRPVAGAYVDVGPWPVSQFFSLRTDMDGHFNVGGLPAGDHYVSLVQDGQALWRARANSTVDAPVALVLPRRITLTGRVLLDGAPVTSFRVRVIVDEVIEGPLVHAPDGRFTVLDVPAGKRWLDIDGDDFYKGMRIDIPLDIPEGGSFDVGDIEVGRHVHKGVRD
jgi:protocatechuate 3,4-dioxygenase beta subunit